MVRSLSSVAAPLLVASLLHASPAQARTDQEAVAIALHDLAPLSRVSLRDRMFPTIREDPGLVRARLVARVRAVLESDADDLDQAVAALALAELGPDLVPEALLFGWFGESEAGARPRDSEARAVWPLVLGRMATSGSLARLSGMGARSGVWSEEARILGLGLSLRFGAPDVAAAAHTALRSVPGVGVRREPTRRVALALAVAALGGGVVRDRALEALETLLVGPFAPTRDQLLDHVAQRARLDPSNRLGLAGFWDRRLEGVERPLATRWFEERLRRSDRGRESDSEAYDEDAVRRWSDEDFVWLCLRIDAGGSARRHLVLDQHFEEQLIAGRCAPQLLLPMADELFRAGEASGLRLREAATRSDSSSDRELLLAIASRYADPRLLWAKWRGDLPIPVVTWLRFAGSLQDGRAWWDDLAALQDPRLPDTALERLRIGLFESTGDRGARGGAR